MDEISDIHRRLKRLEDIEIRSIIGAWVEEARNHEKGSIGLTEEEWKKLSTDFRWAPRGQINLSFEDSMKTLEASSHEDKALYEKLIRGVNGLREVEEPPEF
jgi:hypothetical protein